MKQEQKRRSDNALICDYRAGDELAFQELYLRYNRFIVVIVSRFFPNDCEDMCQEVWLHIIKRLDKFSEGYFGSWVKRLATNFCIDKVRRKKARNKIKIIYNTKFFDYYDIRTENDIQTVSEKMFDSGFRYFDRLNELQKKIIHYIVKGIKLFKISELLGVPLGTCQPAFSSAIVKLRRGLVEDGTITKKGLSLDLRKRK